MAKRKKTQGSEPREYEGVDIFESLGIGEPQVVGRDDADDDKKDDTAALLARIDGLQRQLETQSRTNMALMTPQRPQGAQTVAPKVEEVSYEGLPDPISDAEAYHKELSKRITASVTSRIAAETAQRDAQMAQQRELNQNADALWDEFAEKHPDLAEHRDLVEVAAIEVAQKARRKGVDVQTYMFTASDQYIEDVAAATKRKFGKAIEVMGQGEEEGEDEPASTGRPDHSAMVDQMNGRTRGISGGQVPGGSRPAPKDEGSDFIADIHAVQRKIGIW